MVACISRSLNIHERNYASYKGEMLGMVWAVKTFRPWLHGTHFTVVTDHRPLLWLIRTKELTGQYARWSLALQEYDFEVSHRAGREHINADVLLRLLSQRRRARPRLVSSRLRQATACQSLRFGPLRIPQRLGESRR